MQFGICASARKNHRAPADAEYGRTAKAVLQQVSASVGSSTPAVGVLHPINAFLILGLTGRLAVEAWWGTRRASAEPAT